MSDIRATVRLQFHRGFTLDDAAEWVGYYARLGISHVYASPLQMSRSGSPHGYDGIDPTRIDPELGGEEALERLVTRLRAHGMGLILDIVPNHVAVGGSQNPWWQDVLAWGQASPFAGFFDIDWHSPDPLLSGKVLLPFLGEPYADALHGGQLELRHDPETCAFHVAYHEHRFPLDPRRYGDILRLAEHDALWELAPRFDALRQRDDVYTAVAECRRELRQTLTDPAAAGALDRALRLFDGSTRGGAIRLHDLLEQQHYRLAWWRTGADEINWRRFFDITELGGLRIEQPEVFEAVHALPLRLVEQGWVDGLRIDHIDGLADPRGYCRRLRARLGEIQKRRPPDAVRHVAIFVEKILAADETLHRDWGVDGTTGYELMNEISALQHDPAGAQPLRELWRRISGRSDDFLDEVRQARREVLHTLLVSEFEACVRALHAMARHRLASRDVTLAALRRALEALIVHFPVYRTYADDGGRPELDASFFDQAMAGARTALSPPDAAVLARLERWLGGEAPADAEDAEERWLRQSAIVRFQQLTSPVAAKAVEDTAGYRSAALISRNDVGFDGEHFSHSPRQFHETNAWRARHFPHGLVATATHDHKRGEDVRARLAALSESPADFATCVERWRDLAAPLRQVLPSGAAPSPGDELILYQLLLGAWPPTLSRHDDDGMHEFAERLAQWQQKAVREAKLRTHWLWPDEAYESACRDYLLGLLASPELCREIEAAARELDLPGALNGLVQTALRLTVPGIPDLYQGCEYWDYSLVDPDNRRPVDHAARLATLDGQQALGEALADWRHGAVKQALIARLLALRHERRELFVHGDYRPLATVGAHEERLIAFLRSHADQQLLVVVPRLSAGLLSDADRPLVPPAQWGDSGICLPEGARGAWQSALTGTTLIVTTETAAAGELLKDFPVGIYLRDTHRQRES
ncbi:malto-oligosyltrehalose synthase [Halomonas sp. MCCC 1A11062]|uniref:malto-oligosyltrehalose synthase n=1 Tax=Halomonas sp. MCCC 1A11062 TaxID=2733485 RepID=UPI001F25975E|nr:malto-oligosyltrehalose synthase [Halomonas sp. MCCC 1A11062]MCE8036851.1 malto-oligosyltrehalose synthase [Halomonas sp. MCCC 1A11062]